MTTDKGKIDGRPAGEITLSDHEDAFIDICRGDLRRLYEHPLFSLILNSVNDGILIADQNGVARYANETYLRMTGLEWDDIYNKKVGDVRKGSKLPIVLREGRPYRGIRRKVSNVEYIADVHPIIVEGNVIGAISITRDVTEVIELSKKIQLYSSKVREIHRSVYGLDDIIGKSIALEKVKEVIRRIRTSDGAVLIQGESGTGKELFAHAIHRESARHDNPFVAINCAALSPTLLSSELFGYEEGSLTGARKGGKLGLFEIADNGTLFLDEIGDMELELQSKVLRVLETGQFIKIGGTKPKKVNVRVISATNRNIERMIVEKEFREDLYYRLNVVPISVPPLRERREDIPELIDHFLRKFERRHNRSLSISRDAMDVLMSYMYPGNIRELINIIEFSASICDGHTIVADNLPVIKNLIHNATQLSDAVKLSERETIVEALGRHDNSVIGKRMAADELGISLATLYNKIKQYNIFHK